MNVTRILPVLKNTFVRQMSVMVGDRLPDVNLYENSPGTVVSSGSLCAQGKTLIFGVPGAFTPGCSNTHLPGYVRDSAKWQERGVAQVVCVAVNDPFVMAAWGKAHGADGKVRMLADTGAAFTSALGLGQDLAVLGGVRSKRYSMVVENGVVSQLNVESDGTGLSCSLSENTLPNL